MSEVWADIHKGNYAASDWIDKPSLFAETAITYFPKTGKVLELGAGQGQDSRFFAEHGYDAVSTDLEQAALDLNKSKLAGDLAQKVTLQQLDLREALPYEDAAFDVVYAHLSLHYFDTQTTHGIFSEIERVLKPGGVFAFLTNSTSDPEYGTGKELEPDYFQIEKMAKRYFSVASAREFAKYFAVNLLDNHGETYKDAAKGIHNLIRFVGTKVQQKKDEYAVPCAGAIIEREADGEKELLVQTRWQPGFDSVYSGTLEFPIGRLDVPYEDVFATVAREVKEETGLTLQSVRGEDRTPILAGDKGDAAFGFRPFCCIQQLKNGRPWIGFVFICSVAAGADPKPQINESKDVRWVKYSDLKRQFKASPDKFFALQQPAWEYYFRQD